MNYKIKNYNDNCKFCLNIQYTNFIYTKYTQTEFFIKGKNYLRFNLKSLQNMSI